MYSQDIDRYGNSEAATKHNYWLILIVNSSGHWFDFYDSPSTVETFKGKPVKGNYTLATPGWTLQLQITAL